MPRPRSGGTERYRQRFRRLRRAARALVLENGALCDELARTEAKWLLARGQRRFLLARLLGHRRAAGHSAGEAAGEAAGAARRARRARVVRGRGGRGGGREEQWSAGIKDEQWSAGIKDEQWSAGSRPVGLKDDQWSAGSRPVGLKDDQWSAGGRALGPSDDQWSSGPRPAGSRPRDAAALMSGGLRPPDEPRPARDDHRPNGTGQRALSADHSGAPATARRRPGGDEEEEEDEDDHDDHDDHEEDEDEEDEEDEEDGAALAFGYSGLFLGSPAGSDE